MALAVALSVGLASAPRAQAVVGIVTLNVGAVVVGAVLAVGGYEVRKIAPSDPAVGLAGFFLEVFGIVLLGKDASSSTVQFKAISAEQASNLNISDSEMVAFNNQLDEINMVTQTIASKTANMSKQNQDANALSAFAHSEWIKESASLDPQAVAALGKVSESFRKELSN